jgi:hypothetical protein
VETRTSGSAGGHGKRTQGNPDTAPVPDLTATTRRRSCPTAGHRWSAACATFWNPTRQILGVGDARNRTRRAVERTVPFGLICFSVVTVWYALHGHAPAEVANHRARARWYTTKTEPSYDDMAIKLRRVIIAARFRSPCPEQATPQETRAVLVAWAAARHMINKKLRNTRVNIVDKQAGYVSVQ